MGGDLMTIFICVEYPFKPKILPTIYEHVVTLPILYPLFIQSRPINVTFYIVGFVTFKNGGFCFLLFSISTVL